MSPVPRAAAVAGLTTVFGLLSSLAFASDTMDPSASRSEAGNLEEHQAQSKDPDEMTAESHDPSEMTVGAEQLEDHEGHSENPDDMVVATERLEDHQGATENFNDLRESTPDDGFESIEVAGQADWGPTTDPEILAARKNLVRVQKRASTAREAYGEMMHRNYPRGAARVRIVEERDASMQALEEAKQALSAVE
jgi:hypothetical protein